MNININSNQFKIFLGLLIISLFILIPLTLFKGTVPTTVGDKDAWRCQGPISTANFDLVAAMVNKQVKHGYIPVVAQEEPPVTLQWTQTYGGPEDDEASSVLQTADNGFILVGTSGYLEASKRDAWLVKIDPQGVVQWNQTYGDDFNDRASSITKTAEGGFALVGTTNSYGSGKDDFWLVKTDADGYMQWMQTYSGLEDDGARAIIQTVDGGFILAGWTRSYEAGPTDAWLVKTDLHGVVQWNRTYGGPGNDYATTIIQTFDSGFAITGSTTSYGAGKYDFWLVKTDPRGEVQWNRTYGDSSYDEARSVIQTADGGFILAGSTWSYGAGYSDVWLVKTDLHGVSQWNQTYGYDFHDEARSVIQTADGGFVLAGCTGLKHHPSDFWLIKTDVDGYIQWNRTYGGRQGEGASTVIQTVDGGFALAGYTGSYGAGSFDAWLVKLVPIPETTLTTSKTTTPKETPSEPPVTTTEIPLTFEFTSEFEGISILLVIPLLLWLRRKSSRG